MIPRTILIEDSDFHNAWARAVRIVLRTGHEMVIGDTNEQKPIHDTTAMFVLTGNAIDQIERHELHPQYQFKSIYEYCNEFTDEFLEQYMMRSDDKQFSYLYYERLVCDIDQLEMLRNDLETQKNTDISSNRSQAITWHTTIDGIHTAAPCLQRIWIRYLGDDCAEVHLTWRSRDLYNAWQANVIAIVDMLNREVMEPNNCKIIKLVDYSDSLHIYDSELGSAMCVSMLPTSPHTQRR